MPSSKIRSLFNCSYKNLTQLTCLKFLSNDFDQKFLLSTHNAYANHFKSFSNGSTSSDLKRHSINLGNLKNQDVIKDALKKKKKSLVEKKDALVTDIKKKQIKVKKKVEEVIDKENIFTIPNVLTVGRGILAPYVGYIIIQGDFQLAMSLLGVAALTDFLDGKIARSWPKQASKFGSFLDPLADKLLVGSMVISMGYCDLLPIWLAGVMLTRDVFLIGAGFVIRYISLPSPKTFTRYFDATKVTAQLEPTLISKINTAVQLATIGISLGAPIWNYIDNFMLHGLWYLTGITTTAAAVSYITNRKTFKIFKKY